MSYVREGLPSIMARGVRKVFGHGELAFEALKGVDFEAWPGEFVIIRGPSGSGKSTLLSLLSCLLNPSDGQVELLGKSIVGLSQRELADVRLQSIGFVFQASNLIASISAQENVALIHQLQGVSRRKAMTEAVRSLALVGLGDKTTSLPAELSGGQQQRVAIARSLVGDPPLLLADEPTSSLDAASGQEAVGLLRSLASERGHCVVMVTHDDRVLHFADRIVHIEDGLIVKEEPGQVMKESTEK